MLMKSTLTHTKPCPCLSHRNHRTHHNHFDFLISNVYRLNPIASSMNTSTSRLNRVFFFHKTRIGSKCIRFDCWALNDVLRLAIHVTIKFNANRKIHIPRFHVCHLWALPPHLLLLLKYWTSHFSHFNMETQRRIVYINICPTMRWAKTKMKVIFTLKSWNEMKRRCDSHLVKFHMEL